MLHAHSQHLVDDKFIMVLSGQEGDPEQVPEKPVCRN